MQDGLIAPALAWIEAQAGWAPLAVFMVAFIESLPLIGLFLPGSALLLGLGALVGAGALPLWPVMVACIAGAVLGDAIGYWVARAVGPSWCSAASASPPSSLRGSRARCAPWRLLSQA
jgi:membrane protein DedA with SNARE-associated domain